METKISRSVDILGKLKYHLDFTSLLKLYYALIHSHINHCLIIWGNTYSLYLTRLTILQNKAIRIVNNCSWYTTTSPLYQKCNILSLSLLIKFEIAKFIYIFSILIWKLCYFTKKHIFMQPDLQTIVYLMF